MKMSALSWTTKKMALAGEVSRRLLNTSPHLVKEGWADEYIEKFDYKLLSSGYNQGERDIIIKEGFFRYRNILSAAEDGERPIYRPGDFNKKSRAIGKIRSKQEWYGKSNDAVLFVQATPGEQLRKKVQDIVKTHKMKIKVVEKGGHSIKSCLQRSDVDPTVVCGMSCAVCETGGRNCSIESVGYKVTCLECEEGGEKTVMHGETGRCARVRCNEHRRDLIGKKKSSNLWEHCQRVHNGRIVDFKYEVTRCFMNDPMSRQLDEARRIFREAESGQSTMMNDKNEWVRPAGIVVTVSRM